MPIVYENPKDNPKREAKLREYLDFLATSNNLDKSGYEAFFFIGKFCKYLKTNEWEIFLEKKAAQILTKTLESLSEKRYELKFESETNIEIGDKPKFDEKDFRESIFSYILFVINILCKDVVSKKFKKDLSSLIIFIWLKNYI
jgi:hypothetical protein